MKSYRLETIFVGSELLTGKVNTHIGFLGRSLLDLGLTISREHTVGDDPALMKECFSDAFKRSDIIVCCGGLGPTFDDITRDVWSAVLKRSLRVSPQLLIDIEKKFKSRKLDMPLANRRQADVLQGAHTIPNKFGTAPGQWIKIKNKSLILLPGPTREMVPMFQQFVAPFLKKNYGHRCLNSKIFLFVGIPESKIDDRIRPFVERYAVWNGCKITHAILASNSIVSVKFLVEGTSPAKVHATTRHLTKEVRQLFGEAIFGEDDTSLEKIIGEHLRNNHQTVSVAESCTGGLLGKLLTEEAGSSDYFVGGVISYHNESKRRWLDVSSAVLARQGAVSRTTAELMAKSIRKKSKSTFGLSITGIAGPSGGTALKPVGLVYVGCSGPQRTVVKEFRFSGDRAWIRHRAALMALDLLRHELSI